MLSHMQQRIILKMYGFWLRGEIWTRSEIGDMYKSQSMFYNSIRYLEDAGIIYQHSKEEDNKTYFSLGSKGVILARIICKLPDMPDWIQGLAKMNHNKKLDLKIFDGEFSHGN